MSWNPAQKFSFPRGSAFSRAETTELASNAGCFIFARATSSAVSSMSLLWASTLTDERAGVITTGYYVDEFIRCLSQVSKKM